MSLASHPVAKIAKRRTVPAGELAFRNWAQNLPYITGACVVLLCSFQLLSSFVC